MTQGFNLKRVEAELRDVRRQLVSLLGLREETKVERTADEMDQIQEAESRELAARNLDSLARQLRLVDEALDRIEEGDYGICVECDEEIGLKRLTAVPWAQRCLRCQEASERIEARRSRSALPNAA
ncbi:MAG: TraR/DksA family transcriptional regulator [Bryobacterales bacterium]|nr:TraR/DksA family transcriptional regulator [Bryobacterales bacterium]